MNTNLSSLKTAFRTAVTVDGPRRESGDTLLEVVIAIVVISIGAVALVGALTTSITSSTTYRSLATVNTVLKSFAEAVKYDVQLAPSASSVYTNCATSYQIVSEYPTTTVAGGGVTVFGSGFAKGTPVSVTLNGTTMPILTQRISADSGSPTTEAITATFNLPATTPPGPQSVSLSGVSSLSPLTVNPSVGALNPASGPSGKTVTTSVTGFQPNSQLSVVVAGTVATPSPTPMTDANGNAPLQFVIPSLTSGTPATVVISDGTYSANSTFAVTSVVGPPGIPVLPPASAISSYTVEISTIQWWNNSTLKWDMAAPGACTAGDDSGTQLITVEAAGTNNVSDSLSFVITDPVYRPSVAVTSGTIAGFTAINPAPQPVVLTATVTGTNLRGSPTGTIAWSFNPSTTSCSGGNTSSLSGTGNTSSATCTISAAAGVYQVSANYSGSTNGQYNPSVGVESVTVGDQAVVYVIGAMTVSHSTPSLLGATVVGPTNGPTPTGTVSWVFSAPANVTPPTCSPSTLGPGPGNSATTTFATDCVFTLSTPGAYQVTAVYSGDTAANPNYTSATSIPTTITSI